eukprot:gene24664-6612_t
MASASQNGEAPTGAEDPPLTREKRAMSLGSYGSYGSSLHSVASKDP